MFESVLSRIMAGVMVFGGILLSAIMLLISVDVCMRYFLNSPIQGSFELVEFFMGMLSPVVILYCDWHRAHVAVDLFFAWFPKIVKKICAIITSFICFLLAAGIAWRSLYLTHELYTDDNVTSLLYIPWWPVGVVIFICFSLMTVIEGRVFYRTLKATDHEEQL